MVRIIQRNFQADSVRALEAPHTDGEQDCVRENGLVPQLEDEDGDDELDSQDSSTDSSRESSEPVEQPPEAASSENQETSFLSEEEQPQNGIFVCRAWPTSQKKVERYVANYLSRGPRLGTVEMEGTRTEYSAQYSMMARFWEESQQCFPWDAVGMVLM